jgi:hypothetical protein
MELVSGKRVIIQEVLIIYRSGLEIDFDQAVSRKGVFGIVLHRALTCKL